MASAEELAALRQCEKDGFEHRIPNGVTNLRDILLAMSNPLVEDLRGEEEQRVMLQFPNWKKEFLKFSGLHGEQGSIGGLWPANSQTKRWKIVFLRLFQMLSQIKSVLVWLAMKTKKRCWLKSKLQ